MSKYDYGDYLQQQFTEEPAKDFDGEIVGSCFQQAEPDTDVFPADAKATFVRCNLNNCTIPKGCTVGESSINHQHREQNDLEQWVLDKDGKPTTPLHEKAFDKFGLSKDPKDIPVEKVPKSPVRKADEKDSAEKEITLKKAEIAKLKADHGISLVEVIA